MAAEGGWNPTALMAALHQGLSKELTSLDDLIDLVLRIDNRIRVRRRARGPEVSRGSRRALHTLSPVHVPDKQGESRAQPMQLRHTRLSQSEHDTRMWEGRCLYWRSLGHLRPACPELQEKRLHPSGEGGPLTDSTSPPRAQGLSLSTTVP
ncbi:hypothetical protein P4O66_000411 [Electrophorus voltai]|uniref:Uncharacterized protein n=1 Tax=Electrophorus voltai TaxID=2609070 RepID=A0AAD8ZHJ5_9TELE|nr:hypothetical protein P4O66_000411 [Electrophorus voltai]